MNQPKYALSIRQPWAWLVLHGGKDVENRTWDKPKWVKLPMRVYIHASRTIDQFAFMAGEELPDHQLDLEPFIKERIPANALQSWRAAYSRTLGKDLGTIVGEVTITAWTDGWAAGSPWFEGPYGLILADPVAYDTPIPCKGRLGLFVPDLAPVTA